MSWFFKRRKPVATVAFNMAPRRGPYGGGSQWLRQLTAYLKSCGYAVQFHLDKRVDCVAGTHAGLSGALTFSYEDVLRMRAKNPLVCFQRINDNDMRKEPIPWTNWSRRQIVRQIIPCSFRNGCGIITPRDGSIPPNLTP